ncbi:MAG: arginine deiminase family protein [Rhodothermales bacterium]
MSSAHDSPALSRQNAAKKIDLNVSSETGILQQVIVHTPGEEMAQVSPEKLHELLFEDILHLEDARAEHQLMCRVFRKIVGHHSAVLQISSLLGEALQHEAARFEFIEALCDVSKSVNLQAFEQELKRLSPEDLKHFALTGQSLLPIHALPIPNLMFTRDVAAVVGNSIILSHPATTARARESIIMRVVVNHHPLFKASQKRIIDLPEGVTFEGGDLLVVSDKVILIGNSERTSFGGVMNVAKTLFEQTDYEHVVMVTLPAQRSCMHLDTVFTFASPDECVVFPPLIENIHSGNVVRFSKTDTSGQFTIETCDSLQSELQRILDNEISFIPCGGSDPLAQRREQWTDGANFFSLAPGLVIGYERNMHTFEEMSKRGYRVVTAKGFLSYYEESDYTPGEKMAIKLEGNELSRGRGGPRCMTMPLSRKALV